MTFFVFGHQIFYLQKHFNPRKIISLSKRHAGEKCLYFSGKSWIDIKRQKKQNREDIFNYLRNNFSLLKKPYSKLVKSFPQTSWPLIFLIYEK